MFLFTYQQNYLTMILYYYRTYMTVNAYRLYFVKTNPHRVQLHATPYVLSIYRNTSPKHNHVFVTNSEKCKRKQERNESPLYSFSRITFGRYHN